MLGDTNPVYFFIAGGIPILDFAIYLNDKKLSEDSYLEVLYTENHLQKTAFVSVPSLDPLTSYNFSALALNSRSLCNFAPVVGPERMVNTTNVTAPSMPNLAKYKATGGGITMTMINPHDSGAKVSKLTGCTIRKMPPQPRGSSATTDPSTKLQSPT